MGDPEETGTPEETETPEETVIDCPKTPFSMIEIQPGTFMMGSPADEHGRSSDFDAHEVTIAHSYCIGAYEVTYDQYVSSGLTPWPQECQGDCPVHSVNWHDVAQFSVLLSEGAGLEACYSCTSVEVGYDCQSIYENPMDCGGYRLPTESEWEYAARAGSTNSFWNDGDIPESYGTNTWICDPLLELSNGDLLADMGVYCWETERPHSVGQYLPNPWGLYDVIGNIQEWIHEPLDDPPTSNQWGVVGLLKGGSYGYSAADARAAYRQGATRTARWRYGGARLVITR